MSFQHITRVMRTTQREKGNQKSNTVGLSIIYHPQPSNVNASGKRMSKTRNRRIYKQEERTPLEVTRRTQFD